MPKSTATRRPTTGARDSLAQIRRDVVGCERCPRLREYCLQIARTKRRAYREQEYWGKPLPGFGDAAARLILVGLAPAAHGANRTGRMFTGDSSGDWLFEALHAHGFAEYPFSTGRHDGQSLDGAFITAAVRCAPPGNKPLPEEIAHCSEFLERELQVMRQARIILALGQIGFNAALRLLEGAGFEVPRPRPRFAHCAEYGLRRNSNRPMTLTLLASYHPSRQNTQTGKLTRPMWHRVFRRARQLVDG